ncbi:MAG: rubrerythrin family protein [Candidatus ainarchaeum sp.]|nr:rubrerythrin family protein [Candidatus ainarchaeum sp.]
MRKTEENLKAAFAGESSARNKYAFFASVARKEGFEQIAAIFEETAENEKEHAKLHFKMLKGIGSTKENLKAAAAGELYEFSKMYPEFEKQARADGNIEAAELFRGLGEIEGQHRKRFEALLKNLEEGKTFKKPVQVFWKCRNCGHIHTGKEAPETCPVCKHPRAFFEQKAENY